MIRKDGWEPSTRIIIARQAERFERRSKIFSRKFYEAVPRQIFATAKI